jgi:hypothetical protein
MWGSGWSARCGTKRGLMRLSGRLRMGQVRREYSIASVEWESVRVKVEFSAGVGRRCGHGAGAYNGSETEVSRDMLTLKSSRRAALLTGRK